MNKLRPDYYKRGGLECWDVIRAMTGDGFNSFLLGNIMKYLWRHDEKGGAEDLKKARTYLTTLIEEEMRKEAGNAK